MKIRIATRKSELALTQTRWVAAELKKHHPDLDIEEVHIVTKGDQITDRPLAAIGGKGLFIAEVEAALVAGGADLAVHSLKDVPGDTALADGMAIVCVPEREDPRDVLLTREGIELDDLPAGAKVGTTSQRRSSQLAAQRPDLQYATLRGNVGTRLRKLDEGQYDAIVLAAAGLRRLGLLEGRPHRILEIDTCLPAVGQGTLAIEGRDLPEIWSMLAPLEHADTKLRTAAERAMLIHLHGNCHVPIAGHAELFEGGSRLRLRGVVASTRGDKTLTASSDTRFRGGSFEDRLKAADALGIEVAEALLEAGARELIVAAETDALRMQQQSD